MSAVSGNGQVVVRAMTARNLVQVRLETRLCRPSSAFWSILSPSETFPRARLVDFGGSQAAQGGAARCYASGPGAP